MLKWTFFFHLGNATLLHNGLLGMPLAPALAGYPFAARPPGTVHLRKNVVAERCWANLWHDVPSIFFSNLCIYIFLSQTRYNTWILYLRYLNLQQMLQYLQNATWNDLPTIHDTVLAINYLLLYTIHFQYMVKKKKKIV